VDHGAKVDQLDFGSRDTANGDMLGHRWIALNYAEGLPPITSSICITQICKQVLTK